jgi:DNA repair protein RAD50
LTLIVGYNGSGKTTIIECLKYATTGDLPPNSKGGAFIHDPSLCAENEVLAQVKLSFQGTSGARMVCTRSLQLTVKKSTRSQKTLEGQLLMIKDGERISLSKKVVELDQIMPRYLGVSKAVLESVIFCHQEESSWPMSEPATLKKKFDEIFEALKYSKAIDNIKTLRKKQVEQLNNYKQLEGQYKVDLERSGRMEQQSRVLSAEIEAMREETIQKSREIKAAANKAEQLRGKVLEFEHLVNKLDMLQEQIRFKDESIRDLEATTRLRTESDEELSQMLEKHEEIMSQHQAAVDTQESSLKDIEQEMKTVQGQIGAAMTSLGKLEAEKQAYDRQVERREAKIKELARANGLTGFEGELDEMQLSEFMDRVPAISRQQKLDFDRSKRELRAGVQKAQDILSDLKQRKSALKQAQEAAMSEIKAAEKKIAATTPDLNRVKVSESAKTQLESSLVEAQQSLKQERQRVETERWDSQSQQAHEQLVKIEETHRDANQRLIETSRNAGEAAKVRYLLNELKEKRTALSGLTLASKTKITELVGPSWSSDSLEADYRLAVEQRAQEYNDVYRQKDGLSRDLDLADAKIKSLLESLKQKEAEGKSAQVKVEKAIQGDDISTYQEVIATFEANQAVLKKDVEIFAEMYSYYQGCKKTAAEKSICQLCDRQFKTENEKSRFSAKIEKHLNLAVDEDLKKELDELDIDLKSARGVSTEYDTYMRLTNKEIPEISAELARSRTRRDGLATQITAIENDLSRAEGSKQVAEALSRPVQNICKLQEEISSLEKETSGLQVEGGESQAPTSVEGIEAELLALSEEAASLRSKITQLTAQKNESQTAISRFERQTMEISSKLSEMRFELEKREMLNVRIEELQAVITKQRDILSKAEAEEQSFAEDYAAAEANYEEALRSSNGTESILQAKISKLSDGFDRIKEAHDEITKFVSSGSLQKLSDTTTEATTMRQRNSEFESSRRQLLSAIEKARDDLRDQEQTKATISNNVVYRRNKAALAELHREVRELHDKYAEADHRTYVQEAKEAEAVHTRLQALQQSKIGSMQAKDAQLAQLISDWERDYKDTAQNHKEAHIKVETTRAAIDDLGRYATALDQAIMRYHSLKMQEINRIMEELWRKTYQGTDVDTILIRSDNENAKGKQSYNYRVCSMIPPFETLRILLIMYHRSVWSSRVQKWICAAAAVLGRKSLLV